MMPATTTDRDDLDSIVAAVIAGSSDRIEDAVGLPPAAYVSQAFFDLEIKKIFKREWICVGHVSQVANVGDYFTFDMFGESLVVVRGPDRIRVMSRICLHRWADVVEGSGNTKGFTCPFHNWAYALDGRLLSTPFMEKAANFDIKTCRLPEIKSEIVEDLGLIFVTFADEIDSISERLESLSQRLSNYRMKELVCVIPSSTDYPFNWKFQIETGIEAYHHFGTHRNSLQPIYPTRMSWCEEDKKSWTICHSPTHPDANIIELPVFPGLREDEFPGNDLYLIYPATRFGIYPDRIRLRLITPVSPNRTVSRAVFLVRPEVAAQMMAEKKKLNSDSAVGREDSAIDVMQQKNAASAYLSGGRLSPLEATVWHFAEYIRAQLRT
jgi:phenylpropionate dioxygenase-like ring-hydroxylating dioxygenase large terminal subunit